MFDPQMVIVAVLVAVAVAYLGRQLRNKLSGNDDGGSCPACRKCAAGIKDELSVLK